MRSISENSKWVNRESGAPQEGQDITTTDIEANDEALTLMRDLTPDEVTRIVETVASKIEGIEEEHRAALAEEIIELSQSTDKALIQFLRTDMTDMLNEVLYSNGAEESVSFSFHKKTWDEISDRPKFRISEKLVAVTMADAAPKDKLQEKLSEEIGGKTGFIDPEHGVLDANLVPVPGMENITLKGTILNDLNQGEAGKRLLDLLSSSSELLTAIRSMNPDTKFSEEDAQVIFETMQGKLDFVSSFDSSGKVIQVHGNGTVSVARLQQAFANISDIFSKTVGEIDGKCGPKFREALGALGAGQQKVAEQYVEEVRERKIDVGFDIETVEMGGLTSLYQKYHEVCILEDNSTSTGNDRANRSRAVEKTNYKRRDGQRTFFSLGRFTKTSRLLVKMSDAPDAQEQVVDEMRNMRISGENKEYGFDAALRTIRGGEAFSDKKTVKYTDKLGREHEEPIRRLLEISTDERLQNVSLNSARELLAECEKRGIDLLVSFSMNDDGSEYKQVPIQTVVKYLEEKVDLQEKQENGEAEVTAEDRFEEIENKISQISWGGEGLDISQCSSFDGDTKFEGVMDWYRGASGKMKIDAANQMRKMLKETRRRLFLDGLSDGGMYKMLYKDKSYRDDMTLVEAEKMGYETIRHNPDEMKKPTKPKIPLTREQLESKTQSVSIHAITKYHDKIRSEEK